jgi:hypothetical protein
VYSWIRSIKSLDDIKKPGFLKIWIELPYYYRQKLRKWVEEVLHEDWKEVKKHVRYLKYQKKCVEFFRYRYDGDFVVAVQDELGDHTQVANIISKEALHNNILYYRKLGLGAEEVADFMGMDVNYIERIATPERIEDFGGSDVFLTMVVGLLGKGLVYLRRAIGRDDLPVKDLVSISKLAVEVLQYAKKEERDDWSRLKKSKRVDVEAKAIKERHKMYLEGKDEDS